MNKFFTFSVIAILNINIIGCSLRKSSDDENNKPNVPKGGDHYSADVNQDMFGEWYTPIKTENGAFTMKIFIGKTNFTVAATDTGISLCDTLSSSTEKFFVIKDNFEVFETLFKQVEHEASYTNDAKTSSKKCSIEFEKGAYDYEILSKDTAKLKSASGNIYLLTRSKK